MEEGKRTILVHLARPARKAGGDRYETLDRKEKFVVYVPQDISRPNGQKALDAIKVSFEVA